MRPVDADALLDILRCEEQYLRDKGAEERADGVVDAIMDVLSAETIEPERKGEWIDPGYDSIFEYVESYAKCDQCGKVVNYGREMNFCPNCGSDMRGNPDD